jgi:hypothetical protein
MLRITITLNEQEKRALIALAEKEFRDPRSQAALIIRMELQRQGLIETAKPAPAITPEVIETSTEKQINIGIADDKQE